MNSYNANCNINILKKKIPKTTTIINIFLHAKHTKTKKYLILVLILQQNLSIKFTQDDTKS